MLNIGIMADGGGNIGMGHIVRTLSLAKEFEKLHCNVLFLSRIQAGLNKITSEGFAAEMLESVERESLSNLESEIRKIKKFTDDHNIDVLIIDSYNVSIPYLEQLKKIVKKLVYIDDINAFMYPVDILINGNITGDFMNYSKNSREEIMLLGLKYNLIRDEYKNLPKRTIKKEIETIMITTGGSDPYGLSLKIINILLNDDDLARRSINIIIGNSFLAKNELYKIAEKFRNVSLFENLSSLSEIMMKSDVAITAGGSTLYELCACGTPALAFIMAKNQEFIVQKMSELGYVESLGWYHEFTDSELIGKLKWLCSHYSERVEIVDKLQGLVDGEGARRVVENILELVEEG